MTHTRKLVSAVCSVLLCLSYSVSNAQDIATDQLTGNVITNNWQGTTPINNYGGYSGGWQPGYIDGQKAIVFGYNQGTASQSIAINAALNAAGVPVQVKGYNYSWYYYNNDMNRGTLSGTISLTNSVGSIVEAHSYDMPQTGIGNWIPYSGTQIFANPYTLNQVSTLNVSFTGKDDRWWAGYYGPAVKNIDVRLAYGSDPCATNPAYSTTCAGFDKIVESNNIVPNPDAYAVFGSTVNNSFAINQALGAAGTGIAIHGFKWGYVANANGPYCNSWDMGFFGCWDIRVPSATTNVNITSNTGESLYNVSRTYQNSYNTTNYSYLFPASRPMNTLGSFNFSASTTDAAYVGSMWTKAIYTPDPCAKDPTISPTCPGYAQAMLSKTTTTVTSTTTDTSTGGTTSQTTESVPNATTTATTATIAPTGTTTSSVSTTTDVAGTPTTTTATTSSSPTSSPTATSVATASAPATATPSATNPQPKIGEIQTSSAPATTQKSTISTSQILSIVANEQTRIGNVEKSVVQEAVQQAVTAGASATAQAESVAAATQAQSIASSNSQSATSSTGSTSTSMSGISSSQAQVGGVGLRANSPTSIDFVNVGRMQGNSDGSNDTQSGYAVGSNFNTNQQYQLNGRQLYIPPSSVVLQAPTFSVSLARPVMPQVDAEVKNESIKFGERSLFDSQIQSRTLEVQQTQTAATSSVKKNVKDNEAAGNVTIDSIAKQPVGYTQYFGMMPDVAFYAPKEIYRNQKTVDNARVMRGLTGGSDALHQEMVNQQYNRGN